MILYICFGSEFAIAQSRVFIFTEIKHPLTFSGSFTPSESLCSQREHEKKIPPTISNLMPDIQLEAGGVFPEAVKVTKGFSFVDVFIYSSCPTFD